MRAFAEANLQGLDPACDGEPAEWQRQRLTALQACTGAIAARLTEAEAAIDAAACDQVAAFAARQHGAVGGRLVRGIYRCPFAAPPTPGTPFLQGPTADSAGGSTAVKRLQAKNRGGGFNLKGCNGDVTTVACRRLDKAPLPVRGSPGDAHTSRRRFGRSHRHLLHMIRALFTPL